MTEISSQALIFSTIYLIPFNIVLFFTISPIIKATFTGILFFNKGLMYGNGVNLNIKNNTFKFIHTYTVYLLLCVCSVIYDVFYINIVCEYLGAL